MTNERHPSSLFIYFVATALGVSFSAAMLVLAWNNALENETRNFAFDAIAVQNTVAANIRTADAVINNLASFLAVGEPVDDEQFAEYTSATLARYEYIRGMAGLKIGATGEAEVLHSAGSFAGESILALMAAGGERIVRQSVAGGIAALPLVPEIPGDDSNSFFLVQATTSAPDGTVRLAALSIDLASLVLFR